jgi:pimeloyl-ACP methyl ester carboxylesterase
MIRFVASGDASARNALVLLHAFPVGTELFAPQQDAFRGWRIVSPALPGFDGSELLPRADVDDYARHIVALVDELHIDRAVFAGVSMGGYLAFGILRHAADRVAGIVLADTRSGADMEVAREGRRRMLQVVREGGPAAVADEMIPKLLGDTTRRTQPELVARVRSMIERQRAEAIAAAVEVLRDRPDSTPLLTDIRVPALIVVGTEDTLTPPAEVEQMADAIPASRFVRIEGVGHLSNIENPVSFNAELQAFLDTCVHEGPRVP